MAVTVRVPTVLRRLTDGRDEVEAEGATVAELLETVGRRHDGFRDKVMTDGGTLRPFLNVFVNGEDIRFGAGLETAVRDGDEVSIVPSVAGGQAEPGPPAPTASPDRGAASGRIAEGNP
jgi:MoaD family protein